MALNEKDMMIAQQKKKGTPITAGRFKNPVTYKPSTGKPKPTVKAMIDTVKAGQAKRKTSIADNFKAAVMKSKKRSKK
jgi:hypothetical protein